MRLTHTIYQPAGSGPFPALLTLHGRGANALDLLGLAPALGGGNFFMLCPQAPLEIPIAPGMTGYAWYPMSLGGPPDTEAILSAREQLEEFFEDALRRYPLDPTNLVVVGFSQGGVMGYSLALAHPERFTALAVLSSWLPGELLERLSIPEAVRSLPVLVQHGTEDPMIEIGRARASVERLRALRLPLTYREYDMGHEIRPRSLADLSAWLEKKRRGGRTAAPAQ